jgi:CBS domain-containing protein
MNVEDIMIREVFTIDSDATVKKAVRIMNKQEIGCLIAVKNKRLLGIITERDMLKKVLECSRDPEKTKVREVMSKQLITGAPHMSIADAARLMIKGNIKKLPIMVNDQLIGLITLTDIARSARLEAQMTGLMKELSRNGWLPPKRMKKVLDYYIS